MPVSLPATVKLYHEDNFAKAPRLTMTYPAAENFSKDAYALDYLGELLSDGKKTPLYKVLVKDKKLTSQCQGDEHGHWNLTGSFRISSYRQSRGKSERC